MPHRVLVVDDDNDIRGAVMDVLSDSGYEAIGAANGQEALDKLSQVSPCLIFLDLMMPVMDGIAFREEQLRRPELAAIPVVVVSAYRDAAEKAAELRVSEHLKKPLDLDDLLAAARRHCVEATDC